MDQLYATKYNVSCNYSLFDLFSNTTISLVGNYSKQKNNAATNYMPKGMQTENQIINSPSQEIFYAVLFIDKGLGFVPWEAQLSASCMSNTYFFQTLGVDNKNHLKNMKARLQLQSNYKRMINGEIGAGLEYSQNELSFNNLKVYQVVQRYNAKLTLVAGKRFRSYAGLEYVINNSSDFYRNIYYVNAAAYYNFLKNKIEVGIEGNNILNLNNQEWISVASNGLYTSEIYYYQLPGYIMLRLNYRF